MSPPESVEPILVLRDVRAGYGGGAVLEGVSLAVRPGEVVGLVGPNGSGKTTAVRVASRALRPWEGSVRVGGEDPYGLSGRDAARLGLHARRILTRPAPSGAHRP